MRSSRWSCYRANIPRHRETRKLRRTLSVRRKDRDPGTPGFRLGRSGRRRGRGGLRRKAHPEHLPSFADRKAPRAFHHNRAESPGLALHYQCRDYAPLQSRSPCLEPPNRGCPSAQLRVPLVPSLSRGAGRGRSRSHKDDKPVVRAAPAPRLPRPGPPSWAVPEMHRRRVGISRPKRSKLPH